MEVCDASGIIFWTMVTHSEPAFLQLLNSRILKSDSKIEITANHLEMVLARNTFNFEIQSFHHPFESESQIFPFFLLLWTRKAPLA